MRGPSPAASRRNGARALPDRGGLLPLWTVRAVAGLVAVLLGAVVWNGSVWIALPVVIAAGAALLPSIGLVFLTLLLLVAAYAVNMPAGSPWLFAFVAGLHLILVLDLLLLGLPLRGWISTSALRVLGSTFLKVQMMAQPLAAVALLVDDAGSSTVVVTAGVLGVVAWSAWVVSRRSSGSPASDDIADSS
jgi:hypothetical protein